MQTQKQPDALEIRWRELTGAADATQAGRLFDEIVRAYGGADRHYHNLAHIADFLALSSEHAELLQDRATVDLAIFFHDLVYVAGRSDNEENSAKCAADRLGRLGLPAIVVSKVEHYVAATKHGSQQDHDGDLACLLDFDLSALGADREAYARYAAAIRREYSAYPGMLYRRGRARILRAFLERPQIYGVPALRVRWEASARENLVWEIGWLAAGMPTAE